MGTPVDMGGLDLTVNSLLTGSSGTGIAGTNITTNFPQLSTTNAFTGRLTTTDGVASGTAKTIGGMAFSDVNATDDITAVTSNNAFVTFAQTYSVPANTLKVGTMLRAVAYARITVATATVPTLTCKIRLGGTDLIATTAIAPTAGNTTDTHRLEFTFVSRAAPSATSSCTGSGFWHTLTSAATA